jgi:hypothetical protein
VRRSRVAVRSRRVGTAGCGRHGHPDAAGRHRRRHPGRRAASGDAPGYRCRRPESVRRAALRPRAARGRHGAAGVPAQGASRGPRPTRSRDPRSRRGRLRDRPEGRRGPREGEEPRARVTAAPADAARARRSARDGRGEEQRGDRRDALPHGAVGREGDPLDLPQARHRLGALRSQAREGRPRPRWRPSGPPM